MLCEVCLKDENIEDWCLQKKNMFYIWFSIMNFFFFRFGDGNFGSTRLVIVIEAPTQIECLIPSQI